MNGRGWWRRCVTLGLARTITRILALTLTLTLTALTGKEYIGDDMVEIRESIKGALLKCCGQLKKQLAQRQAQKAQRGRKKELSRRVGVRVTLTLTQAPAAGGGSCRGEWA